MTLTATHRPPVRKRRSKHDAYIAGDFFSGFGGLSQGIQLGGFDLIVAANHNSYKVEIHEANHPEAEHWIADLVNPESADYHDVRQLPAVDFLGAGVSCKNHSQSNSKRAYATGGTLFDVIDDDYEAAVTKSERDRATANCVLHYAAEHHPSMILIECTTELTAWGAALPNNPKIGDGTTFRWWLRELVKLGYRYRVMYLNSRFFGVDQSRDRLYIGLWDNRMPTPDLEHRPETWCWSCETVVEAKWTWKTGVPPSGAVRYGKQYCYRCPSCRHEIVPPSGYALRSLDLTDLGTKIGDRARPLAAATMARAERCRQKFADFPAVVMPAKAFPRGSDRHPWQPLATQTSQQEHAVLSTGALIAAAGNTYEHPGSTCRTRTLDEPLPAQTGTNSQALLAPPIAVAVDNFQGAPRGADQPFPTQPGSETLAVLSSGVLPFRKNTIPTTHAEAMPTVTAEQIPGLLTAAGFIKNNGSEAEAKYRAHPLDDPFGTVTAGAASQSLLFSGWSKENGSSGDETAPHPSSDPLGAIISRNNTSLLHAEWRASLSELALEDCYFRMMREHEIGRGCGFDVDFGAHRGTFKVWGSASKQVDGFGNAVSPQVGQWISTRMYASFHGFQSAA